MSVLVLPAMTKAQRAGWSTLMTLADRIPTGWCLVGGQMVHLHCWERGANPSRPTDDGDVVLDIRSEPRMLQVFTEELMSLGYSSAGETMMGHQHRWVSEDGQIDVFIPRFLGKVASNRTGATGGTTIETPGGQRALDLASQVTVAFDDHVATIWRPTLHGAIVAKSAAFGVLLDSHRQRHLFDLVVLSTLLRRGDIAPAAMTNSDLERLGFALGALKESSGLSARVAGGSEGIQRLTLIYGESHRLRDDRRE
jgi:hypothetical protein